MGIGKVLPTLVILSISAMMVFSLLPVYAHNPPPPPALPPGGTDDGFPHGTCNGPWGGPFSIEEVLVLTSGTVDATAKDRNLNHHVCVKASPGANGGVQVKDDNPIPK